MTGTAIDLFTIGFTQTSAAHFFGRLQTAGPARLIDVRLHNTSQLAGFAKAEDLRYFLDAILGVEYRHEPELAPTQEIFEPYKKKRMGWEEFSRRFLDLMEARRIDQAMSPDLFDRACLLCSEAKPHGCHRKLVADYLNDRWDTDIAVRHL